MFGKIKNKIKSDPLFLAIVCFFISVASMFIAYRIGIMLGAFIANTMFYT